MQYKSVKGFSGWTQFGFLLAFVGLGLLLTLAVQFVILMKIVPEGVSLTDKDALMKAMLAPENLSVVRLSQVLGTLCLLFIPAILWSRICNGGKFIWLGFNKYLNGYQVLFGFLIIFAAGVAAAPLVDLTKNILTHFPSLNSMAFQMEKEYNMQVLALSHLKNWPEYIAGLFIMAFFPAMFEEVFFRGVLQNLFVKWLRSPWMGIIITSIIFSLIHLSIYLFFSRLLLGVALGLMFYYTKNIWVNIIAHFINNAIALTQMFVLSRQEKLITPDKLDPTFPWGFSLLALAATVFFFIMLKKYSAGNRIRIEEKENLLIAEADPFRSFTEPIIN